MEDSKEELREREAGEETYSSDDEYKEKTRSKKEVAEKWEGRIESADKVYKAWSDRFRIEMLNQYYEGFQWFFEVDENNRPLVINMIQSTIETKLPNLLFDNPQYSLRARPIGTMFNENDANDNVQIKEDALNYVCNRTEFGLSDKHELATLDAFFGFGVMEADHSDELYMNPNIPTSGSKDVLDNIYCKQIPFDTFRAAASANWDLSTGRWYGYYEFIPWNRLEEFKDKLNYPNKFSMEMDDFANVTVSAGKIEVATDTKSVIGPPGTCKIWKLWDFDEGKFIIYAPDDAKYGENILLQEDFDFAPLSFLRISKRRKGWYPYPPIWNWISPQDEINDARQAQRLHRKRFTRKYLAVPGYFENNEELDKFLYGPDGTVIKVNRLDAIKPVEDAPLDPVSPESIGMAYDDFNRVSGTSDPDRNVNASGNRTSATQAGIMEKRSQIREAKDALRVGDFMCSIGKCILKALRKTKKSFWIKAKLPQIQEGPMMDLKPTTHKWKTIPPQALKDEDYDVDLNVTSVSPISAQQDKQAFMEFLAVITQYEILAFSPALLKEAAYRCGYKNEAVLNQFMQMSQLASIGRLNQLKGQAQPQTPQGPQGAQPGQLAQQQMDASTPPDNQQIMNTIFNRPPVQK